MWFKDPLKKQTKREAKANVIRGNSQGGDFGERVAYMQLVGAGYENIKRAPHGHDFTAYKRSLSGNLVKYYIEVKTGKSKLSALQNKMKKKYGSRYKILRLPSQNSPGI